MGFTNDLETVIGQTSFFEAGLPPVTQQSQSSQNPGLEMDDNSQWKTHNGNRQLKETWNGEMVTTIQDTNGSKKKNLTEMVNTKQNMNKTEDTIQHMHF